MVVGMMRPQIVNYINSTVELKELVYHRLTGQSVNNHLLGMLNVKTGADGIFINAAAFLYNVTICILKSGDTVPTDRNWLRFIQ